MFLQISFVHWLVILSAFVSLIGGTAYIRDTLSGKSKPNRVSWSMWTIAPLIGTAAAISAHADIWVTIRIFLAGFIPLLVFVVSFVNPKSYWKLSTFDFLCGACSVLALIVWGVIDSPRSAILFAAIGDGFAALPTILKAWKYPETETGLNYIMSFVSVLLIIPSIQVWNIENSAFQVYLLIVNTLLIFAVYRKRLVKIIY
ncbi:MAG: hypothetical protein A3B13_00455 [Candidatus Liptonbacteria bacterium RIFCSPLOWO2_01_FULL_45_15]|uniref:Uncharacterized protein n=1 Tax=Candidatus Liptonbacteria bacterium RIFCSPLOWO2_01_FULL_45_15 TaxID=1798649 RepID=A0A1G2CJ86_9BACT|nr:MAG: hypothetical protein A3B13_00455 [Candidatus Liptonbacteria bacterium RIFCSPLOWO2_01_FULL_45_15]